MVEKIWEIKERKFDDLIDQLLYNRGIILHASDMDEKEKFFSPDFAKDLHDPFLLSDMAGAVEKISESIKAGEKIGIFADYDADGIPGAALLARTLQKIGVKYEVFIPNRDNGYGLSCEGIDILAKKGCQLIVTIDLGIRNILEAKYCQEKKISLIITDHHLPGEEIPDADFVINPKRKGDKYPFKELCGCGVAYKLVQALAKHFHEQIDEKFLKWNLDLVAISTISDVVPLSGENRVLVKYGLIVFQKTQNVGLIELCKVAGIRPSEIGAYQIGFQIGPRINAPGRIDNATESFELLVTDDADQAQKLAIELNEKNLERQAEMDEIESEATKRIEKKKLDQNKIIILDGNWSKGVIGPTASRLVEKYGRPVILFSRNEENYTGSARSVSGVHILQLLEKVRELLVKYGGHSGAAGLSVAKENYEKFRKSLIEIAEKEIGDDKLVKKIAVDAKVILPELSLKLFEMISTFEPFGLGNSRPVFATKGVSLDNYRFVGRDQNHLSMLTKEKDVKIKSIYFNCPDEKNKIDSMKKYDVVFSLNEDNWQNQRKLSLNIIDLRESDGV